MLTLAGFEMGNDTRNPNISTLTSSPLAGDAPLRSQRVHERTHTKITNKRQDKLEKTVTHERPTLRFETRSKTTPASAANTHTLVHALNARKRTQTARKRLTYISKTRKHKAGNPTGSQKNYPYWGSNQDTSGFEPRRLTGTLQPASARSAAPVPYQLKSIKKKHMNTH